MNNKLSVEICLPVYNEEENILNILRSIFLQKQKRFSLKGVVVYCDGCTDGTFDVVSKNLINFPKLKIINDNKRKGKLFRLNQIYKSFDSDILVVLDADIGLVGKSFIDKLILPIIKNKNITMVAAKETPIQPHNLLGKIIWQSFVNWDNVTSSVPNYDTVHSFGAAATAYKRGFAKSLKIPRGLKEERMFLFLSAKKVNGYQFNKNARILYWPVSTIKDLRGLMRRSFGEKDLILDKMFGFETDKIIKIPLKYKVLGIGKSLITNPFLSPIALIFNVIIGNLKNKDTVDKNSIWEFSESTKKAIFINKHYDKN